MVSDDLSSQLSAGSTNYIYGVHLHVDPIDGIGQAICKMARLVITYSNPYDAGPPLANSQNFSPYPIL